MDATSQAAKPRIESASMLLDDYKTLHEIVIDGYLRRGETANLIAPPKRGKSWLVLGLAFAVAQGRKWLGSHCRQGRVLIVDAELHPATLAHRMRMVAESVEADTKTPIDILSLRGQNCDLAALAMHLEHVKPGTYELLVLDALYRFLPQGTSENDNAAMMAIYNQIDQIAKRLLCAVVIIHHTSKGSQADKAVTDVGSGAGSISRAADTHITIRDHEESGYQVLEAVTRSFPSPEPKSVYFKFPCWYESDLEPSVKQRKSSGEEKQQRNDTETRDRLLELLKGKRMSSSQLRGRTGFGAARVSRGLSQLRASGEIEQKTLRKKGSNRKTEVYQIVEVPQ